MTEWKSFSPADKIIMTGNPVRQNLTKDMPSKEEALRSFNLQPGQKNDSDCRRQSRCTYHQQYADSRTGNHQRKHGRAIHLANGQILLPASERSRESCRCTSELICNGFHQRHGSRIRSSRSCDFRAGAGSISEFCLLHKPVILVPSPNVAEDHQTKNALALVNKQAAIYVKDSEAETT